MIVIIGAGISGLSLSYYLSGCEIRNIVIDLKKQIGTNHRSTCLISSKIFKLLKFLKNKKDLIIREYEIAKFWYDNKKFFEIKSSNKMFLLNYLELEKEIYKNIDKEFSSFYFGEKVLDVNFEKNFLITDRRKISFEYIVDASGTYSFLANKFNLFKNRKVYSSFEILAKVKNNLEDVNIFIHKKFSREKFGWLIKINEEKSLIGLIDFKLNQEVFKNFAKSFNIIKVLYEYSHPILYSELKKLTFKNSIIIGEAAGLIKPFSFGGIIYGIISSLFASKAIKNNDLNYYNRKIKKIFLKPKIIGKIINRCIRWKYFLKFLNFPLLKKYIKNLDPDFLCDF